MKIRFFSTAKKPDPVATSVYRQLSQTISGGVWRLLGYQSNSKHAKSMKSAAELAEEARRQRLLMISAIVASGLIVCVLLFVMARLLQRPKPFMYPKMPDSLRYSTAKSEELREDVIDSIDRAVAGCGNRDAKQLWKNLTLQITSLEGAFTQSPHCDCECVDKARGTPSLFHLLLHVDENEAMDILTKLDRLSEIMMRTRCQGVSSKEGSRPQPRQPATTEVTRPSTWKKLRKLKVGVAGVESFEDWKAQKKSLKKITHDFNKAIQCTRKELFHTRDTLHFDALHREIVAMRDVVSRLNAFRAFCRSSSDVLRCGQFDVVEFFESQLYERAIKTPVSGADLKTETAELIEDMQRQTAHIRQVLSATATSEPESSEAIDKVLAYTDEAKTNTRKALAHLAEEDERSVLDIVKDPLSFAAKKIISKKSTSYAAIAVVVSMLAMNGLMVVGINRFR